MADSPQDRESLLRSEYLSQTARIRWHDLQTYFAHGSVVAVSGGLDLVEVAVQLGLDNTEQFQAWIASGDVCAVHDEQARGWYDSNQALWAVVAPPWVLVQQRD
jgi:hypothetical protein